MWRWLAFAYELLFHLWDLIMVTRNAQFLLSPWVPVAWRGMQGEQRDGAWIHFRGRGQIWKKASWRCWVHHASRIRLQPQRVSSRCKEADFLMWGAELGSGEYRNRQHLKTQGRWAVTLNNEFRKQGSNHWAGPQVENGQIPARSSLGRRGNNTLGRWPQK